MTRGCALSQVRWHEGNSWMGNGTAGSRRSGMQQGQHERATRRDPSVTTLSQPLSRAHVAGTTSPSGCHRQEGEPCPSIPNLGDAAAPPKDTLRVARSPFCRKGPPGGGPGAFVALVNERSGAFRARRASRDVTGMGEAHREGAAAAPFKAAIEARPRPRSAPGGTSRGRARGAR